MKNYIKIAKNAYHNILLVPQLLEQLQQLEAKLSALDEKNATMLTAAEKTAATVADLGLRVPDTQDAVHGMQRTLQEQEQAQRLTSFYTEQYFWALFKQHGESDIEAKQRFFAALPTATGGFRLLQRGNALLLKKFKDICEANGLQYWLCSGTLIGCLRHSGFIPWDDDLDVAMMRSDFDTLLKLVENDDEVRITTLYDWFAKCKQIRFKFTDNDLPFFVDIFTYDAYKGSLDKNIETESRIKMINFLNTTDKEEVTYWKEHPYLESSNSYFGKIEAIFHSFTNYNTAIYIYSSIVEKSKVTILRASENCLFSERLFNLQKLKFNYNVIFPLQKLPFEGEYYFVPNDAHGFISSIYGDIYRFPKDIFTHFEHTPHSLMEQPEIRKKIETLFANQE